MSSEVGSGDDGDGDGDAALLSRAAELSREDKHIEAVKLLRRVRDKKGLFTAEHRRAFHLGELLDEAMNELERPPSDESSGWKKQSESHGHRDIIVHYKVEHGTGRLYCRIESPVESSLYLPFLTVLNETDLYDTWIPSWTFPFKFGVSDSTRLKQGGRIDQLVRFRVDMPWPFRNREAILHGFACDNSDWGSNGLRMLSVDMEREKEKRFMAERDFETSDDTNNDGSIPPVDPKFTRVDLDGSLLLRQCPPDHEALRKSKHRYPKDEKLVLMSFMIYVDPHLSMIPRSFLNFCTRHAIGMVWKMMLTVAEEVRDGKRPRHTELIESKREELFDWLEERVGVFLDGFDEPEAAKEDGKGGGDDKEGDEGGGVKEEGKGGEDNEDAEVGRDEEDA